jgi:3-oxoacyl-[acyl-carrier protein] reductase
MANERLNGRVAIVTGGSRGIGSAIVRRFVREGAKVVFTYNSSADSADALVKELGSDSAHAVKCDVSNEADVQALADATIDRFGSVGVLVNNAGITHDTLVLRMKKEDFERVLATNLTGAFLAAKSVLRPMMKERWGRIINIASVVGLIGNPGQANYVASKAGLIGLTKSLAREVASRNILVNAIAPGYIETDMTGELNEKQQEAIAGLIPLGVQGKPEDIAGVSAFLASADASYITGQTFAVDGGMSMV